MRSINVYHNRLNIFDTWAAIEQTANVHALKMTHSQADLEIGDKIKYVCIEVAFVEMPMETGVPTGLRGGTHRARRSNIPTPRYQWRRVTHAGSYSRTLVCFLSQLYFRQLRVSCILM